jgi:hypothetical protein
MIAKSRPISHIITDHLVEGSSFDQSGAYAIVHAVPRSLYEEPDTAHDDSAEDGSSYLAHQSSRLVYKSGFATSSVGVPDLFLVHVDNMFLGPAVAVPCDIDDVNRSEQEIFRDWMNELVCSLNIQ